MVEIYLTKFTDTSESTTDKPNYRMVLKKKLLWEFETYLSNPK